MVRVVAGRGYRGNPLWVRKDFPCFDRRYPDSPEAYAVTARSDDTKTWPCWQQKLGIPRTISTRSTRVTTCRSQIRTFESPQTGHWLGVGNGLSCMLTPLFRERAFFCSKIVPHHRGARLVNIAHFCEKVVSQEPHQKGRTKNLVSLKIGHSRSACGLQTSAGSGCPYWKNWV